MKLAVLVALTAIVIVAIVVGGVLYENHQFIAADLCKVHGEYSRDTRWVPCERLRTPR